MLYPCSHCGKDFSLPTPPAPSHGEKFECPHCGGVVTYYEPGKRPPVAKRVSDAQVVGGDSVGGQASSGAGRAGEVDRAVAAGLPTANGPEAEVLLIRPSAVRSQPAKFFGFLFVGLMGLFGALYLFGNSYPLFASIPCAIGGLAAISVPVWMKLSSLNAKIRVTSKRIVDTDGFLNRRVSEVLHRDIRNVRVEQTFSQRIWRVGAIAVYTGGEEAPEIYMENVPDPHRVREVIDLYRPM